MSTIPENDDSLFEKESIQHHIEVLFEGKDALDLDLQLAYKFFAMIINGKHLQISEEQRTSVAHFVQAFDGVFVKDSSQQELVQLCFSGAEQEERVPATLFDLLSAPSDEMQYRDAEYDPKEHLGLNSLVKIPIKQGRHLGKDLEFVVRWRGEAYLYSAKVSPTNPDHAQELAADMLAQLVG